MYSCFYDFASAFDTVEFCVLLEQLSHAGVKGKCWMLSFCEQGVTIDSPATMSVLCHTSLPSEKPQNDTLVVRINPLSSLKG